MRTCLPLHHHCTQVSKGTPAWRVYVEYMSSIVVEGFGAAITASAVYLLMQMDPEQVRPSGWGCISQHSA